jgi:hypothetical protein
MSHTEPQQPPQVGGSELNVQLAGWQPIATCPKGTRVLLGYEQPLFNDVHCVFGRWDDDKYAQRPQPHWTHDMARLLGVRETKARQPVAWMRVPETPNAELRRAADEL